MSQSDKFSPSLSDIDRPAILPLRVVIIEDQADIAELLAAALHRAGMQTQWAATGASALHLARRFAPHVILVDLELPDTDGVPLIKWLRAEIGCGIIVVSGHVDDADRVTSLEVGADDFIGKPPSPRELVARIRAVHRRSRNPDEAHAAAKAGQIALTADGVTLNVPQRAVTARNGERIDVTAAEFGLLQALTEARGQPVSREELSPLVLRRPWRPEDRGIDQLVCALRRKLCPGDKQGLIRSVRGGGYELLPGGATAEG
jgi:DNA-binding response OmpR family regulator